MAAIWGQVRKCVIFACCALICSLARAADQPFIAGADVSMLPTIEKAGGIFLDNGKSGDAIQIMRAHGCNLFRVRLFVNPSSDYASTYGAVQDLAYVRALAKRIKASGAEFLLDIHYSDTWADAGKQFTPAAWKKLDFDALQQKVHDYTVWVMTDLRDSGVTPDMVQVGNEVTAGILWPQAQVLDVPKDEQPRQWQRFAQLITAGCKAVRSFQTDAHPIRIMIHIHGGGKEGMAKYFFGKFKLDPADYDIVGLSFYPAWEDSIDYLKQNMTDAVDLTGKDVILAETSYPWKALPDKVGLATLQWPQTPAGQKQYLNDLIDVIHRAPGQHGIGFIYWYPEAIPIQGMNIWRQGYEALFDSTGNALPGLDVFGRHG
ncbi:MAG: glycosyl hydrolase 53 family protein [Tepidisphaeraceae bacterium]